MCRDGRRPSVEFVQFPDEQEFPMRWRSALVGAVVGAAALLAPVALAPAASAHGWVTNPPSRQDHCASGAVSFDCGGVKYEPQSVEAPKGSMKCSGDNAGFAVLDDTSKPWPRTQIGSSVTMKWKLTAMHATSTWEYFVDGVLHRTFNDNGARPNQIVEHSLDNLPQGNHTILARWNVADTAMAFYSCVDVTVGSGGGNPTPTPTPTDPTPPGDCTGTVWDAGTAYVGGTEVTYQGHVYKAKWWTRGESPASAGQWGVWQDLGAC
jgi:predicted carbohydrate-binding protein with CBM5 and CBM33 domain